jgi:pimeloyl-ACP methyl ester carboxylesterase
MAPETRYAQNGSVSIAYQMLGNGPRAIVMVPGFVTNLELTWEDSSFAHFLTRLASFARLVLFDKRGTGLSDRSVEIPGLEVRMDDVRAVMDAAGLERAVILGTSEGAPMSALFAATHPDRTEALIMCDGYARRLYAPDHPWGPTPEQYEAIVKDLRQNWGGPVGIKLRAPSMEHDEAFAQWWARYLRMGASPAAAEMVARMAGEIDVRHVLPAIRVPTLILHSVGDKVVDVGCGRYSASRIPGAKFIELPGSDHLLFLADADAIVDEVAEFLTGARESADPDRVLATVLFTDLVGSTEKAAALGDRRWHHLLENHHRIVRRHLVRFRGSEVHTTGDGFLATFDGPARAIRCACAIVDEVRALGLEVRAGLHTGECEVMAGDIGGLAVHIGARIAALAAPGEVLVSNTVKDLVAGSGLSFADRGVKSLKGVPGDWRVFSVER